MNILAIETSCDETAIAFVSAKRKAQKFNILAEAVASQIEVHRPYGGVVPSLAKREHLKNLPLVLEQIQNILNSLPSTLNPDCIAVTVGPGLEPALWTGINFAKDLGAKLGVPVVGVNHLEGHIYSNWLNIRKSDFNKKSDFPNIEFPAIVLIVSGGHTILLRMDGMKEWKKLGETQDDAVGEAFDKVAKMLGLPYPGGPEVERLASSLQSPVSSLQGLASSFQHPVFPRPMLHSGDYNFSFSGLKTAVLYYIKKNPLTNNESDANMRIANICKSFQDAAIEVLVKKTMRAAEECGAQSILLCGGVACNKALQEKLKTESEKLKINVYVPETKYNTDNAVMIAAAAHLGHHYPVEKALPNLNL